MKATRPPVKRGSNNRKDVAIGKCPECAAIYWDGPHPNGFRWQHSDDHAPGCQYG